MSSTRRELGRSPLPYFADVGTPAAAHGEDFQPDCWHVDVPRPARPPWGHDSGAREAPQEHVTGYSPSLSTIPTQAPLPAVPTSPLAGGLGPSRDENTTPVKQPPNWVFGSRRHTLPPRPSHLPKLPPSASRWPTPKTPNSVLPTGQIGGLPHPRSEIYRQFASSPVAEADGCSPPWSPIRTRRPSHASDTPSLHLASMVGSYEESILRGRMSTAPSKPLDFMAQIGVLGLGPACSPQLRCPAHVSVPFPAVFYSYSTSSNGRSIGLEEGPSPYVGLIDLENVLPNPDMARRERRKRRRLQAGHESVTVETGEDSSSWQSLPRSSDHGRSVPSKKKRRPSSPRSPPGGSYRIPQKGQLQIVIKNPNKTAVKLFLVPYDLESMEPGTKTFVRQRTYSSGPILDLPLGNSGAKVPPDETGEKAEMAKERPTLRYLVHLHICCPSRDRFFLYKSIRVVFANRVPDGKERLRNEIQLPEPRYSQYRPGRESNVSGPSTPSSTNALPLADQPFRRRSSGLVPTGPGPHEALEGIGTSTASQRSSPVRPPTARHTRFHSAQFATHPTLTDAYLPPPPPHSDDWRRHVSGLTAGGSTAAIWQASNSNHWADVSTDTKGSSDENYAKLNPGDRGYGGYAGQSSSDGFADPAQGLLAKRLRGLDVQRRAEGEYKLG